MDIDFCVAVMKFIGNSDFFLLNKKNGWQESLVLLIEVGPSMHGVLPEVEKVCCLLAEKKVHSNIFCCFSNSIRDRCLVIWVFSDNCVKSPKFNAFALNKISRFFNCLHSIDAADLRKVWWSGSCGLWYYRYFAWFLVGAVI